MKKKYLAALSGLFFLTPILYGATYPMGCTFDPIILGPLYDDDGMYIWDLKYTATSTEYGVDDFNIFCIIWHELLADGTDKVYPTIYKRAPGYFSAVFDFTEFCKVGTKKMYRFTAVGHGGSTSYINIEVDRKQGGAVYIDPDTKTATGFPTYIKYIQEDAAQYDIRWTYNFPSYAEEIFTDSSGKVPLSTFNFFASNEIDGSRFTEGDLNDGVTINVTGEKAELLAPLGSYRFGTTKIPVKLKYLGGMYIVKPYRYWFLNTTTREMRSSTSSTPPDGFISASNIYFPPLDGNDADSLTFTLEISNNYRDVAEDVYVPIKFTHVGSSFGSCFDSDFCVGVRS